MLDLYLHLPPGAVSRCKAAWESFGRTVRPEEGTPYVSQEGVLRLWRHGEEAPERFFSSVIGAVALGVPGRDVDFGVASDDYADFSPREGVKYVSVAYPSFAGWVHIHSEHGVDGVVECLAVPEGRAMLDMLQYHEAAAFLDAHGREEWLRLKRRDKMGAYRALGISLVTYTDDGLKRFYGA